MTRPRRFSSAYRSWVAMRDRCSRPGHEAFHRYGGRGITVCDRWSSFEAFLADMGERPDGKSLERIDNDGHYEPGNVRWATPKEQGRNTSRNRVLTAFGQTQTLGEWAAERGIRRVTIAMRLRKGWPVERAISEPAAEQANHGASAPWAECGRCSWCLRRCGPDGNPVYGTENECSACFSRAKFNGRDEVGRPLGVARVRA